MVDLIIKFITSPNMSMTVLMPFLKRMRGRFRLLKQVKSKTWTLKVLTGQRKILLQVLFKQCLNHHVAVTSIKISLEIVRVDIPGQMKNADLLHGVY